MTAARKVPKPDSPLKKKKRPRSNARARAIGKELEREVCRQFTAFLGGDTKITRNLEQTRDGGYDVAVGPLRIECKRRASIGSLGPWFAQIEAATHRGSGELPVVVAQADKSPPMVAMLLSDFIDVLTRALMHGPAVWE